MSTSGCCIILVLIGLLPCIAVVLMEGRIYTLLVECML